MNVKIGSLFSTGQHRPRFVAGLVHADMLWSLLGLNTLPRSLSAALWKKLDIFLFYGIHVPESFNLRSSFHGRGLELEAAAAKHLHVTNECTYM